MSGRSPIPDLTSRFKGPQGHILTIPLFLDRCRHLGFPTDRCIFTYDTDVEGLINCRTTFLEYMDPTGIKWANEYLLNYEHFRRLKKCEWFAAELEKWIEEIESLLEVEALETMKTILRDPGAADGPKLSAAKYIAEQGWKAKKTAKSSKGRPSNSEISKKAKEMASKKSEQERDAERIGLKVIEGGSGK